MGFWEIQRKDKKNNKGSSVWLQENKGYTRPSLNWEKFYLVAEKPRERNLNCIQQCSIKKLCLVAEKKKMQEKKRKKKNLFDWGGTVLFFAYHMLSE